jgi:hypothetical protein
MHGAVPPLPQYVFMAWCLVKHRDNFTDCHSQILEVCHMSQRFIGYLYIMIFSAVASRPTSLLASIRVSVFYFMASKLSLNKFLLSA